MRADAYVGSRPFRDRRDAGRRLVGALRDESLGDAVVVALARGGVDVAAEVCRELGLPLDVLAVRKVGHPWQPEYAIGAVTPGGGVFVRGHDGLTDEEVASAVEGAQARAEELDRVLHGRHGPIELRGRTCVLVDDGLATGATMVAAVRWAKASGAGRVVVAVPVGAPETVDRLLEEADTVVCSEMPTWFGAVGLWYEDFPQVSDDTVLSLLDSARRSALPKRDAIIPAGAVELPADLIVPADPIGWVAFAHGSGSSRRSPRNIEVAHALNRSRLATLLFDLLSQEEAQDRANVFDVELLADRLAVATNWLRGQPEAKGLPLSFFGASTGAAAALWAAAELGDIAAVVSRGGRPDLAAERLPLVRAPTLLIVGGADTVVLELNRQAAEQLSCEHELAVVPGATHLFEERGALERVAELAAKWFVGHLGAAS